jgi:hypothetical protein
VLVGIGLVGVVSLIFYEVGLTEDRSARGWRRPGVGSSRRSGRGRRARRAIQPLPASIREVGCAPWRGGGASGDDCAERSPPARHIPCRGLRDTHRGPR